MGRSAVSDVVYITWGLSDGACKHVHASLSAAAKCLGARIKLLKTRRKQTDRRVWRLDKGKRVELTGREYDQAFQVWSPFCS